MTIETIREEVKPPPVRQVVIRLSEAEFRLLERKLGMAPYTTPEAHDQFRQIENVVKAL